jgi:integrase
METAIAKTGIAPLPPKVWRKTFRTLARDVWHLERDVAEAFLGHEDGTTSGRHYLGEIPRDRLLAGVRQIEAWLQRLQSPATWQGMDGEGI